MKRVLHVLREANEESFVVLDEPGSGADPTEGQEKFQKSKSQRHRFVSGKRFRRETPCGCIRIKRLELSASLFESVEHRKIQHDMGRKYTEQAIVKESE